MAFCFPKDSAVGAMAVPPDGMTKVIVAARNSLAQSLSLALVFAAVGMVAAQPVGAFSVGHLTFGVASVPVGEALHKEITENALGQIEVTLSTGRTVKFTSEAIGEITKANENTDSKYTDFPEYHFDADQFNKGHSRLIDVRGQIEANARKAAKGTYGQGFQGLRESLGTALHPLQDFYAHSTWIERGKGSVLAPLGESMSVADFLDPEQIGDTCTADGVIDGMPLTSGYFEDSQFYNPSSDWRFDGTPSSDKSSKCKHGTSKLPSSNPLGAGLNKDQPGRENYEQARVLAIDTTKQYVNGLLSHLSGDDKAICGLMGHHLDVCSAGSATPTVFVSFQGILMPDSLNTHGNPDIPPWWKPGALIEGRISYNPSSAVATISHPSDTRYGDTYANYLFDVNDVNSFRLSIAGTPFVEASTHLYVEADFGAFHSLCVPPTICVEDYLAFSMDNYLGTYPRILAYAGFYGKSKQFLKSYALPVASSDINWTALKFPSGHIQVLPNSTDYFTADMGVDPNTFRLGSELAGNLTGPGLITVAPYRGFWVTTPQNLYVVSKSATKIYYTMASTYDGSTPANPAPPSPSSNNGSIDGPLGIFQLFGSPGQYKNTKLRFVGCTSNGCGPVSAVYSHTLDLATPLFVVVSPNSGAWSSSPQNLSVISDRATTIYYTMVNTYDGSVPADPPVPSPTSSNTGSIAGPAGTFQLYASAGQNKRTKVRFVGCTTAGCGPVSGVFSYTIDLSKPGSVSVSPSSGSWTASPQYLSVGSPGAATIYYTMVNTYDGSVPADPPVPSPTSSNTGSIAGPAGTFQLYASAGQNKRTKVRFVGCNSKGCGPVSGAYLYRINLP